MSATTETAKTFHTKKELKKELEGKMESALPEIKTRLGEKKFHRRVRKAAKLLVQGLRNKDVASKKEKLNGVETKAIRKKATKKAKASQKDKAVKSDIQN